MTQAAALDPAAGRVVIVGAGEAGLHAAVALRRRGFAGGLTLIGEEPHAPYRRPPLSKDYLKGALDVERLALQPDAFYAAQAIDLRLGAPVLAIDRAGRSVVLPDGERIVWDRLILATGARPRTLDLPGADLGGVKVLRDIADADALRAALEHAAALAVIGGGYIGLEAAAAARALGRAVTVLERAPRLLARVAGPALANWFAALHAARGVDIRCGVDVVGFEGEAGRVTGVRLAGGPAIPCDVALVGVGVVPNDGLARAAGLACDDGVTVDAFCRTDDPAIFAVGDVANRPLDPYGGRFRLESVPSAKDEAERAAAAILGAPPPAYEPPWFWSDQYDVKLQTAGLSSGADREVVRGDPASGRFAVFSYAAGRLVAADAVNDPASFLAARQALKAGRTIPPAAAADPAASLREAAT